MSETMPTPLLQIMGGYLDGIRADANDSSVIDAMQLVDKGVYPVQWVRQALAEGLRNRADHWRRIASTAGYRFTEGRSVEYYLNEAEQDNTLAEKIETGKEITYAGRVIPSATQPFSI